MTPRLPIAFARAITAALIVFAGAAAFAQPAAPRLTVVRDFAVKQTLAKVGDAAITIGLGGEIIIAQPNSYGAPIIALDSTGSRMLWSIPTGRGDDKEIRMPQRLGWLGTTLWIGDPGFDHAVLVNERGDVTKSIEEPTMVRPTLADRRKFPIFGDLQLLALYSDGTMLVLPRGENSVVSTPEYDRNAWHIVRISAGGAIQRVITKVPREYSVTITAENGRRITTSVPFEARTSWAVSPDGMRVAVVSSATSGSDSAMIRVTSLNERGDTVYSRRFPFTPERIRPAARDSALRRVGGMGVGADSLRAAAAKSVPVFHPPVRGVAIGRDRTVWITLRTPAGSDSLVRRLVLDPRGDPIGIVAMPLLFAPLAMDRTHVWGVERTGLRTASSGTIVRYRVTK